MKRNIGVPLEEADVAAADEVVSLAAARGMDSIKRAAILRDAIRAGLPIVRRKYAEPTSQQDGNG